MPRSPFKVSDDGEVVTEEGGRGCGIEFAAPVAAVGEPLGLGGESEVVFAIEAAGSFGNGGVEAVEVVG